MKALGKAFDDCEMDGSDYGSTLALSASIVADEIQLLIEED